VSDFQTRSIELPPVFLEYLLEESIFMPSRIGSKYAEDNEMKEVSKFIEKCLDEYNAVFIKLDHVSPKDANFSVPNLEITNENEVYTLLKSSTRAIEYVQTKEKEKEGWIRLVIRKYHKDLYERI
jgi:hypothetical protein